MVFKEFWEQNHYFKVGQKAISKWGSFDNLLFQSGASVILKRDRDSFSMWFKVYFNVGQLFQSRAKVFSKWGSYFKDGQMLFQSGAVISKWGNYI